LASKSSTNSHLARIALVGNPNAGKTTLFNALTGSSQKVGNYPGVTVEKVTGQLRLDDLLVEVLDVPGLYSLEPVSEDESVAVAALGEELDLIVCVVDASNLERNLYLYTQVAELQKPTIVALTMVDRVEGKQKRVNFEKLKEQLGCPVVGVVGHKEKGLDQLKTQIAESLESPNLPSILSDSERVAYKALRERLARIGFDVSLADLTAQVRENDPQFENYFERFPELREEYENARRAALGERATLKDASERYQWTSQVQLLVIENLPEVQSTKKRPKTLTDKLDVFFTHRIFGLAFFIGIMYLVFQSIYSFSSPVMDLIEKAFEWLGDLISPRLESIPVLQSLVVDGIIAGIGGVLVFLPQILVLFFFISLLEGTGYLARAAFLMDRLLGWCGLNGRAFIPLLSSFACAIPGIMAARVMPDPKSRLATILVAPLMSCSARLPVYMLLIGAVIEPKFGAFWAGFALFAMHLLGLVVAIPIVFILNKGILKGKRLPFLLELPPYQMPKWKDVFIAMLTRGKVFVTTAGTTILFMSIVIWAAGYFPRLPADRAKVLQSEPARLAEAQLEYSALGRFGKTIEPVFTPVGFDWRISTAIMSAFPARETVVPSIGILFSLGSDQEEGSAELRKEIKEATWPDGRPLFTPWTAVGLMVFFALCAQCFSTLATVRRETNSRKWAWFMFAYMTGLAYLGAWIVHLLAPK
jgi:ferrous iron transport protein B